MKIIIQPGIYSVHAVLSVPRLIFKGSLLWFLFLSFFLFSFHLPANSSLVSHRARSYASLSPSTRFSISSPSYRVIINFYNNNSSADTNGRAATSSFKTGRENDQPIEYLYYIILHRHLRPAVK